MQWDFSLPERQAEMTIWLQGITAQRKRPAAPTLPAARGLCPTSHFRPGFVADFTVLNIQPHN